MPDLIKGQNATQRAGSAETYAKRYALCSALGIQTGDDDDDGNAGGETITDAQAHQLRKLCEKTKVPEEKLCEVYAIAKFEQLPASLFHAAKTTLEKKLPKGQQELET
jgi:hypothetical protein